MASHNWKKTRIIDSIPIFDKKYYIFCEGTKTEPNYFAGIKKKIEAKGIYRNSIFIDVQGVGEGTLKIIEYAKKYIDRNKIKNAKVWVVYDKDDFKDEDFNAVASRAQELNKLNDDVVYSVAWSNQCIEYWFILHFDYYVSDNDRAYYIEYLTKKFKEVNAGKYEKNDTDIFEKLEKYGSSEKAVKYAEKRLVEMAGLSDAKSVPATTVHLLYKQLSKYF